jgi:NNP family nitrate/nitrite transporter-like MFS transporter
VVNLSDKIGGEKTSFIGFSLMILGALLLSLTNNLPTGITGVVIMGVGVGLCNAAVFKLVPKYVPESVGGAAGWVGGLGAFGGFIAPPILGSIVKLLDTPGYARGFIYYVIISAIAILVIFSMQKRSSGG